MTTSVGVRLYACVMAHPSRAAAALKLQEMYPELNLKIVLDPEPDSPHRTAIRSARLAWSDTPDWATHHLVIQDDAVLYPDFARDLLTRIDERPEDPLALHTEWGSRTSSVLRLAAAHGIRYVRNSDPYVPTIALAMPSSLACGFADWLAANVGADSTDDGEVGSYLCSLGQEALVTVPNLAGHEYVPSLVGNDFMGERGAACFIGADHAGPNSVLALPEMPFLSWMRGVAEWHHAGDSFVPDDEAMKPLDYLREHQVDRNEIEERYRRRSSEAGDLVVGDILLFDLYCAYFALGFASATMYSTPLLSLDDPVVFSAMSSAAPGGWRRFLSRTYLKSVEREMATLTYDAIRDGLVVAIKHGVNSEGVIANAV